MDSKTCQKCSFAVLKSSSFPPKRVKNLASTRKSRQQTGLKAYIYIQAKFQGWFRGERTFSQIFILSRRMFFADWSPDFFPLAFVWGKSAQKNHPGKSLANSFKFYTTKIPDIFLQRGGAKKLRGLLKTKWPVTFHIRPRAVRELGEAWDLCPCQQPCRPVHGVGHETRQAWAVGYLLRRCPSTVSCTVPSCESSGKN